MNIFVTDAPSRSSPSGSASPALKSRRGWAGVPAQWSVGRDYHICFIVHNSEFYLEEVLHVSSPSNDIPSTLRTDWLSQL